MHALTKLGKNYVQLTGEVCAISDRLSLAELNTDKGCFADSRLLPVIIATFDLDVISATFE